MNTDTSEMETPPPTSPGIMSNPGGHSYMPPAMVRSANAPSACQASIGNKLQSTLSASSINSDEPKLSSEFHSNVKYADRRQQERYIWEIRTRSPNVTPASTVLNSPDLNTDGQYSMHLHGRQQVHQHHPHHQIRLGRSPVGQFEQHSILHQGLASPGSPTDIGTSGAQCLRDGEVVVFDDIDTNWMNRANSAHLDTPAYNEDILKVTKMIGQLPIAEYEGSPRRFGSTQCQQLTPQQQNKKSITNFPKRPPGFPQRISPQSVAQHAPRDQQEIHSAGEGASNDNSAIDIMSSDNLIDIDDEDNRSGCNLPPTSTNADCNAKIKTPTFDYLYEFSETRKVLEEFFKGANIEDEQRYSEFTESDDLGSCGTRCEVEENTATEQAYVGQRLARLPKEELCSVHQSPRKQACEDAYKESNDVELYIDSNSRSSEEMADTELETNLRRHSRNFTLSPETTDYDSNCGDLDSLSNDINCPTDFGKLYTSMPVLEDGLSSGHASDTENNLGGTGSEKICEDNANEEVSQQQQQKQQQLHTKQNQIEYGVSVENEVHDNCEGAVVSNHSAAVNLIPDLVDVTPEGSNQQLQQKQKLSCIDFINSDNDCCSPTSAMTRSAIKPLISESSFEASYATVKNTKQSPSHLPPAPSQQYRSARSKQESTEIQEAMNEIRSALQRAKTQPEKLKYCDEVLPADPNSPVWVPRKANVSTCDTTSHKSAACAGDEEEADTDLETDRLLGQQRLDEEGYFEEKTIWPKTRTDDDSNEPSPTTSDVTMLTTSTSNNIMNNASNSRPQTFSSATIRQGVGTSLTPTTPEHCQIIGTADVTVTSPKKLQYSKSPTGSIKSLKDSTHGDKSAKSRNKEGFLDPVVLIEGVLFRARYLGSTQLVCEGQPTKSTRMLQAEEAVSRIKAPEGENQPSTEVDLFISTEKIMVLNTDLKEIMMDHALRTISYIADIGDLVVLMARRRFMPSETSLLSENADNGNTSNNNNAANSTNGCSVVGGGNKPNRTPKMICHVFESDEAQFIAQSIGQAFQVAYMEFLKANGIEDHSFVKEMDYQEVLNSQEIFGDELEIFAKKELQKEVVVPKVKGEILGVVIVESGWGSMLPTVVIANLMSAGAAARCGQLNIGDQLIAINGMSLVGLPLSTCQSYIRNAKNQTAVKFTVVPCAPVVEVKIKRPNTKYQLGFSVQNGVICSLLRGGIAERGGVRVGHRIIEINNQSVVAVPHEKIVNLLATSVGEILMKTMPTSMFRLLTGQENPIYI